MSNSPDKVRRRIFVVSPFLDKRHGTERAVVECFSRLAGEYEVHVYSQRVEDLDLAKIRWHRIPALPGPHIFNYLWWFAANHIWRRYDRLFGDLVPELVFSPGVNCLDADVVSVHIVFAMFVEQVRSHMLLRDNPARSWPRLIHRRLYYRLILALEGMIYRRSELSLAAVSRKVASDVIRIYGRSDEIAVVYHAIDPEQFSPERRTRLRDDARGTLGLKNSDFVILIIGNDWKNKGLPCLLEAVRRVQQPQLKILVVGEDDTAAFAAAIAKGGLAEQIKFLPPRPEVEFYYAAADLYAGPSLEDAFSLPPVEAMACGLPVITSREAGVSELITPGLDGMILEDPADSAALAEMIRQMYGRPELRNEMGRAAALTAGRYTWERNAEQMRKLFEQVLSSKNHPDDGE